MEIPSSRRVSMWATTTDRTGAYGWMCRPALVLLVYMCNTGGTPGAHADGLSYTALVYCYTTPALVYCSRLLHFTALVTLHYTTATLHTYQLHYTTALYLQ